MSFERAALEQPPATLVDVLDRVLDRGVVINADILISLAGVPLIGINLRAALAGMQTMLDSGLMVQWDERVRAEHRRALEAARARTVNADEGLCSASEASPLGSSGWRGR
jgi:hypothetical protein